MATLKRFEDIDCWIYARELVKDIYYLTSTTSLSSDFGLKDQIQRTSVSIMSNIAEGFDRGSKNEFIRFLHISRASCSEVRSIIYILLDLGYIDQVTFKKLHTKVSNISKMLLGLINYLKTQ